MSTDVEPRHPGRKENAVSRRRRLREFRRRQDEDRALELFVEGKSHADMAAELKCSRDHTYTLLRDAMERHALASEATADEARVVYLMSLRRLMESWMPRAIGQGLDVDLQPAPPDLRAAEFVLKVLEKVAGATGVTQAPKRVEMDVTIHKPDDIDAARDDILQSLVNIRNKAVTIEGHLADAGTSIGDATGHTAPDDRPAPPPQREISA